MFQDGETTDCVSRVARRARQSKGEGLDNPNEPWCKATLKQEELVAVVTLQGSPLVTFH